MRNFIGRTKELLNLLGDYNLDPTNEAVGVRTDKALDAELEKRRPKTEPVAPVPTPAAPPWYMFAKKYSGKNENDSAFNKEMSAKWSLFGLNLGTIAQNWAAWCGLAMAVSLASVGISYQHNGAGAKNWATYGQAIEWRTQGIPRGAIIHINHAGNCNSGSNNHVSESDGNCSPADLLKPGATINLYGGNQGNTWKVSSFSVKEICEVRWPKDYPLPALPIKTSEHCSGSNAAGSTK